MVLPSKGHLELTQDSALGFWVVGKNSMVGQELLNQHWTYTFPKSRHRNGSFKEICKLLWDIASSSLGGNVRNMNKLNYQGNALNDFKQYWFYSWYHITNMLLHITRQLYMYNNNTPHCQLPMWPSTYCNNDSLVGILYQSMITTLSKWSPKPYLNIQFLLQKKYISITNIN